MSDGSSVPAVQDSPVRDELGRFPPGVSGNPAGRPAFGLSMEHWVNELGMVRPDGRARYSVDDWTQFAADGGIDPAKRKAAQIHLRGEALGFAKSGRPLAGEDIDRAFDRTVGTPLKRVEMSVETVTKPADLAADAIALIRQDPRLIRPLWPRLLAMTRCAPTIREQLRPILQQHAPDLAEALDMVDTTARALPPTDAT